MNAETTTTAWQVLHAACRRYADLAGALHLMGWDQEVMMPPGGAERRASQMGTLAGLRHRLLLQEVLPQVEALRAAALQPEHQASFTALVWQLDRQARLPEAHVQALTEATAQGQQAWEHARDANDYAAFAPHLQRILDLKRQEADHYGYSATPYDALLEDYEPGATTVGIAALFAELKPQLVALLRRVQASPHYSPAPDWLTGLHAPEQAQWQLGRQVATDLGYSFTHGRLDASAHPFSTSFGPEDSRITTRVHENDLAMMLYGVVHEVGHALYEMGLPPDQYGLPGGEACSLGMHESQSRLWENHVARSRPFCHYLLPHLQGVVPTEGRTPDDLFRAVNTVAPGYIRISADELTYHLHILLRFELEVALIEGRLSVAELPEAWNDKVKEYLGLDVPSPALGVLQDIHWSHGSLGYFPTYTLGTLAAAQLYATAQKDLPGLEDGYAHGQFAPLLGWLRQHVHRHGRLMRMDELMAQATGQSLTPTFFLTYLSQKMTDVYYLAA